MRTWLFVPGHDTRKVEKALRSAADVVILDWEDAVPEERKQEARRVTEAALRQAPAGPRPVVRVNNTQHPQFADDVALVATLPASAVLLPKVDDPAMVADLAGRIPQPVIPLIESALGVERVTAIARAHPRVERLSFGPLDFMADLGVLWTAQNEAYHYARLRIALAGRAAGLAGAIDGVYPELDNVEGLRQDALAARALGYAGKMLLHPAQIPVVQEIFSPTADERARAQAIMSAFAAARARGEAVVRLGGQFIDPPVVRWAEQVLAQAPAPGEEAEPPSETLRLPAAADDQAR